MPGYTIQLAQQGRYVGLKTLRVSQAPPPPESRRGIVQGWGSEGLARHSRLLWSLDVDRLPPGGTFFTGTVRDRPHTGAEFNGRVHVFVEAMRYEGIEVYTGLTEWQPRYDERKQARKAG